MNQADALLELMQARRSVRKFADRPVDRELLNRLFEAARWAPSNHNRQPWKFLVWENRAAIQELAAQVGRALADKLTRLPETAAAYAGELTQHATCFASAPVLVIALHKHPTSLSKDLLRDTADPALVSGEVLSTAMAVQNLLLAAHAHGLGACILTAPLLVDAVICDAVSLPPAFALNCLVALGYPAETPVPPRRKSLAHIVEFGDAPTKANNHEGGNGNL